MDRPPLKVSFPSEISAAFCATLVENDISYSTEDEGFKISYGGLDFVVNSAEELKEIAIAIIESKPFWGTVATAIWAFARRHKNKAIYVEKDGYKFKASGMSQEELSRILKDATNLIITERDLQD